MLITGAGSGIGKACALRFARDGLRVALLDVSSDSLQKVGAQVRAEDGECLEIATDVSDAQACHDAVANTLAAWGSIDVLVANAGVQIGGSLLETGADDWQKLLEVNLNGVAYSCKAVLPAMRSQEAGSIVIVSSVNAVVGSAGMTVYDMSKAGLLGLMRSLATEYGTDGIRVNAICPGNTITDFHIERMAEQGISVEQIQEMTRGYGLLGRAAEPDEIANAIYFLASDEASFVTGHNLVVDGGFSITGKA